MRALVTGGTGFVGSHLIDALLARGDAVTALVRSPAKAADLPARGVRVVLGDLHDRAALVQAAADQEVVYHVAGLTGALDEAEFMAANRDGTANLVAATAAQSPGARFVLVSSMAAGGPSRPGLPRSALQAPAPVTMYGRSKLAGEEAVRGSSLPWVILRPPTIYGPRDRDNLIAVFKIARLGIAPVFGSGAMELSAIYVTDLAEAIVAAGMGGTVVGGTFYTNHPEIVTSGQLVRLIGETAGRRVRILPVPSWIARGTLAVTGGLASLFRQRTILRLDKANEFYQEAWTGDPTPFMERTDWRAAHDLATGLPLTYRWYRDAGWL